MSSEPGKICHEGIIDHIDPDKIYISIQSQSACVSCQLKGSCKLIDVQDRMIEVPNDQSKDYHTGTKVSVEMKKSMGTRAVVYAYLLPFLVLVISLFIFITITSNEGLSGILSLALLVPYYLILYFNKQRFQKAIEFEIFECDT